MSEVELGENDPVELAVNQQMNLKVSTRAADRSIRLTGGVPFAPRRYYEAPSTGDLTPTEL